MVCLCMILKAEFFCVLPAESHKKGFMSSLLDFNSKQVPGTGGGMMRGYSNGTKECDLKDLGCSNFE